MKTRLRLVSPTRRTPAGRRVLNVRMRAATARRKRQRLLFQFSAASAGLLLVCGTAWFAIDQVLDRFFYENPAYTVSSVELELDDILTPEDFLLETGIRQGENIFLVDLAGADRHLRTIPMVADVSIERILPDRIRVVLVSREPVAWVDSGNDSSVPYDASSMFLVDASGVLMKPRLVRPEFHSLPVIHGVDTAGVIEGRPLQGDDLKKAIALLDEASARPGSLLRLRSLNISKGYCIDAITDAGARVKFGRRGFSAQLEKLERLLAHCRDTGRELESVNLLVEKNTPVRFVMASLPPAAAKAAPVKSQPKKSRN
jgi:cell division septal protein FtsQ